MEGHCLARRASALMSNIFIKDWVAKQELTIKHCPTDNVLADFFTKPLKGKKFNDLCKLVVNLED